MQKYGNDVVSTETCTSFLKKIFIAVDGKILPCERIDHDFEVGYIYDDFVELDYKHVAERCLSCAASSFCFQCIYHIDDIRNKSTHCPNFYTPEKFNKEKEENFIYLRKHPHYYNRILNEISFTL